MRTVILVPRREDHGHRDELWTWVKAWWQERLPELTIYEGHHNEGLFNRSAAVNRAAAAADDWDVAVLIDSDVIIDPDRVREGIELCYQRGSTHLILPFMRRHNLKPEGSRRIMEGEQGSWRSFIGKTYNDMVSSCVLINRQLWDAVGGFDERFSGWGFEDSAFSVAAETFGGETVEKIEGELWHLWHPTAPEGKRGTPSYQANRALAEAYHARLGDKVALRALQTASKAPLPRERAHTTIPRILHRTVPYNVSKQANDYWAEWGELHPDWEMMNWQDPLDPDRFPMTAEHWVRCTSGAQFAGLIRLEVLYRYGGVYVDSDVQPYRSLEPLLGVRAFAAWEDRNCVPDAVIGAEPEHPAIAECLEKAIARLEEGPWESGPGVTTEVLPNRPDVLLLPPGSFYPYHYREKQRKGEDFMSTQPWAFAAHHWDGSWL